MAARVVLHVWQIQTSVCLVSRSASTVVWTAKFFWVPDGSHFRKWTFLRLPQPCRVQVQSSWCEARHLLLLNLIKVSFLIPWCTLASCAVQVYMFRCTQKFSKSGLQSQMTRWTHSSHLLQKSLLLFERYWGNTTNLALFLKRECLHRIKQVGVFRGSISEHKDLRQGWTVSECQLKTSSQIGR